MRLQNIAGFKRFDQFVADKIRRFDEEGKTFPTLFSLTFSEKDNVLAEVTDGYYVKKVTYGECEQSALQLAKVIGAALSFAPKGSLVGLHMVNGVEWIETFWAIIAAGYRPLLINSRLHTDLLEKTLTEYAVAAVISDGKRFSMPTFTREDLATVEGKDEGDCEWGKEVLFMSSGTGGNVKLCAYTAENFYYQVSSTPDLMRRCPAIMDHYDGELKQMAVLPFYHVFGFIAVYLWYSFFSRTFVFLKDMQADVLLHTIRKHKVTHLYAVPLIWENVYKAAIKKVRSQGEKTSKRFDKVMKIADEKEGLGKLLGKVAFKSLRERLFGDSIQLMITGGGGIAQEALRFFNNLGYHMVNGYGMTEIGITSFDISVKRTVRHLGSIGVPFYGMEYKISDKGELLFKGKARAARIMQEGKESIADYDEWFNTHDLSKEEDGLFYLLGREDDLIVCNNGENINPELVEADLIVDGVDGVCLFADRQKTPTLLVSVTGCFSAEKLNAIIEETKAALERAKLKDEVKKVVVTTDKLLDASDFKVSRKKIAKKYADGLFTIVDNQQETACASSMTDVEKQLIACFALALQIDEEEITTKADFFTDLGGSSLDYFSLLDILKEKFDAEVEISEEDQPSTVEEFYNLIKNN